MGRQHVEARLDPLDRLQWDHDALNTVAVYTQVGIKALKDLHQAMHPAARLGRASETPRSGDGTPQPLLEALENEAKEEAEEGSQPPGQE
jgi:hypothetical protein